MAQSSSSSSSSSSNGAAGAILPHRTLYVSGLDEKVRKLTQRRLLYTLFVEFGCVEDIVVGTGNKLRGQAWVTFGDVNSAVEAVRKCQGMVMSATKKLNVEYAAKLKPVGFQEPLPAPRTAPTAGAKRGREASDEGADEGAATKIAKNAEPYHILVASGIPSAYENEATLEVLVHSHKGFAELRMGPPGRGVCFIEFASVADAKAALPNLDGMEVDEDFTLDVTFSQA